MTMFNKIVKEFQWGQHTVRMETGEIARQASGAVIVDVEDTVVLATVVAAKSPKAGQDFFPLTARRPTLLARSPVASSSVKAVRRKTRR